ncbi:2-keto-myo-inositol dehydratase [Lentzea xinjiangensis]|uniref:2-keto-myo-inositol dehydratase n=1 Tax=Lentzea xinjiangensis TaxID=402600 RepID=A0A1H9AS35_9PSEU|nr:TIM barrel protein [Lentzea xinjiangensis]SEP78728.1 2-keto-myo-inositol dehydratase [Lentzea xinjiangensis]
MAKIAGAPISWGVCEVPGWGAVLPPDTVLAEMRSLGLAATELGPPDYLPADPAALKALLGSHDLALVGGFLAVTLHADVRSTLDEAARVAAILEAGGAEVLVLAAATGLDGYDERPRLTDDEWATLVDTCARIREIAAGHGLRTVLHPHVGTHVEREAEVERFLADSDLPLCLDTGHLLIGGTDPVDLARRHPGRIGHVHLKDVRGEIAAKVRDGELSYTDAVEQGIYVPLGDGDVDVEALVELVRQAGYTGWFVLEQDTRLGDGGSADRPLKDTARSLAHLGKIL